METLRARHPIWQTEIVTVSLADQERFARALLSSAKPNAALQRAFARRRKLIAAV